VAIIGSCANTFNGVGVAGFGLTGVMGFATDGGHPGVLGINKFPQSGAAGSFRGNVWINGDLLVSGHIFGGSGFRIDHPQDPANKYLSHSFVQSPDMKNVYDGVVTLNGKGEATVKMPRWFEALNRDFRYQLTALGAPAPNLCVANC